MLLIAVYAVSGSPSPSARAQSDFFTVNNAADEYRVSSAQATLPESLLEVPAPTEEDDPSGAMDTDASEDLESSLFDDDSDWIPEAIDAAETGNDSESDLFAGTSFDDSPLEEGLLKDSPPTPVFSTNTWFWRGEWYTQLEYLMYLQSHPRDFNLAFDTTGSDDFVFASRTFSTLQSSPRFEPGARITLGKILGRDTANRDHMVDLTFLGLLEWESTATFASLDPNNISTLVAGLIRTASNTFVTPSVIGFTDSNTQSFAYSSDLNSAELNYRVRGRPGRDVAAMLPNGGWIRYASSSRINTFVGGLRFISVNDRFRYTGQSLESQVSGVRIPPESGEYDIRSHNDMFGLQLGVESMEKYNEWYWGAHGKIGGMFNFVDRFSRLALDPDTEDGNPPNVSTDTRDDENLVFIAEAGFFIAYQMRPNMALKASYDWLYLTGLAKSDKNIEITPAFPDLNVEGSTLYQGVKVGFEWIW